MEQENGWPFKLVYLEWAETARGEKIPLGNGLPAPFVELLKKDFKLEENSYYGMPNNLPDKYRLEGCPWAHIATSLPRIAQKYSFDYGFPLEISVEVIKDDDFIYLLPVEITGGVGANVLVQKHNIVIEDKPFSYNFFQDSILMHPNILELLQTGKVKFLFNNLHDPINDSAAECFKTLEERLHDVHGISYQNIIFLSGSKINTIPLQSKVFYDEGLYYAEYMGSQIIGSENENFFPGGLYKSEVFQEKDLCKNTLRSLKFLSPNNNVSRRLNRTFLLHWALKHKLFEDGLFSFLSKTINVKWIQDCVLPHYEISTQELKEMESILPHEGLDTKKYSKKDLDTVVYGPGQVKSWYEQTYLSIVTETSSFTNTPFISEKSYRPIANLHPFIILGPGGILKSLRKLGFKTFAGFIDESYDDIENDIERFKAIEKEIIRFKSMTQQEIHEWYYSLTDILIYNKNHLRSLQGIDPYKPVFKQIYDTYVSR